MADFELLESRLADLTGALEWAPTPRLERRVRAALGRPARPAARWVLALAAAVLAALVLGAVSLAPVRDTVAGWLGLRHVEIHRVDRLPSPAASPGGFGNPVSIAEAGRLAGFAVRVPAALGAPREVDFEPRTGEVTLVYTGALVTEAGGSLPMGFIQKMVGPESRVEQVTVNGVPGVWLEGSPHAVVRQDRSGQFVTDSLRLATNTLVWEERGLVLRVESKVSRDRALEIAGTLR